MVNRPHQNPVNPDNQVFFFSDDEESEEETKMRRVFFDELANDVRYFHKNLPVKEVGTRNLSEDDSVQTVIRKPLHIRIRQRLRNMFTRKKYKGKTVMQWIGRGCFTMVLIAMGITMGYVSLLYLLFLSLAAFW